MANGVIGNGNDTGKFAGIFVDNQKILGKDYYEKYELVTLMTMGDIWVRVTLDTVIKPYDRVVYVATADTDGIYGKFQSFGAGGVLAADTKRVLGARFLTGNINGMAVIGYPFPEEGLPALAITGTNLAEPATDGSFTITRTGYKGEALSVPIVVTGTASPTVDYVAITSPVVIPAGNAAITVPVLVVEGVGTESGENIIITITADLTRYTRTTPAVTLTVTTN
jgi:hypothetical protein